MGTHTHTSPHGLRPASIMGPMAGFDRILGLMIEERASFICRTQDPDIPRAGRGEAAHGSGAGGLERAGARRGGSGRERTA